MVRWASDKLLELKPEEIGEHYGRYRLHVPEAERAMAKSLERYGQLSPVVVCRRNDRYELIDGFKRLGAVRRLAQIGHLSARLMEADERTVKAAISGLNRAGGCETFGAFQSWLSWRFTRSGGNIGTTLEPIRTCESPSTLVGRWKIFVVATFGYGSAWIFCWAMATRA